MGADYFLSLNVGSSKTLADKARSVFHSHGISTWMCTDIEGGQTFREEILANVRDAKIFLIFLNQKWAKSAECVFEYNYAMRKYLTKKSPVIMPIVTEDFEIEKHAHVDALMANFQGVFLNQFSSEAEGFKHIMKKLEAVVPFEASSPAAPISKRSSTSMLSPDEAKELSFVLHSESSQALPSGLWEGYFVDNRALRGKSAGSQWLIDVNMTFHSEDQFTAEGSDEIGSFIFKSGEITDSEVQFIKDYGTHEVVYEGQVLGAQMMGRWWLEADESIKGGWALWPAV